jgi:membrane associated rhomboid family serine protease
MTSAAVGQRCPECAKPKGRSRVISGSEALRGGARSSRFTKAVIGICVALFLPMFLLQLGGQGQANLIFVYGAQRNPSIEQGEYWRLLTSMFLHGGVLHIVMNMLLLWILGPPIEREVRAWTFASLYLASGLTGAAAYFFLGGVAPAVGASGAVFGLFGAWLAAGLRNRHTLQGQAMLRQVGPLVAINLVISFIPGLNIAWQAHIGGFVAGFVIAFVWGRFRPEQTAARGAVGAVVAIAAVLSVILGSGGA